jgi:hypothetical protein
MKTVRAALILVLALGLYARPAVTQMTQQEQGHPPRQEVQQINNATAANELAELVTPTINATPSPLQSQEKASGKRHRAEAPRDNQPSKQDWMRCLQDYACQPRRDLFRDKWDARFGGSVDVFTGH